MPIFEVDLYKTYIGHYKVNIEAETEDEAYQKTYQEQYYSDPELIKWVLRNTVVMAPGASAPIMPVQFKGPFEPETPPFLI